MTYAGQPYKRLEDRRLLTGGGRYVEDIALPGMLHVAFVRSEFAHARIVGVDRAAAEATAGVVAVVEARDVRGAVTAIGAIRREGMGDTPIPAHPVLADGAAYYVGQPVAAVVATSRGAAKDGAAALAVRYEEMAPIVDPWKAAQPGATPLHPEVGGNVVMRAAAGAGDVDGAFAKAARVVRGRYEVPRLASAPMECRGVVASYEEETDTLRVWTSTQVPHRVKTYLGNVLVEPPRHIQVIAPDVGGGFGRKIEVWPEEVLLAHLARRLRRPVKWVEERSENTILAVGRGYVADVEAAVEADGRILGMRFKMVADLGAFFLTATGGPPGNAVQRVAGPYAIPAMAVECLGVLTNKPPTGPYRGAGGPEAAVLIERSVDAVAHELGLDPADVRRRNLIQPGALPYTTATGLTYDSGDFPAAFDRALELAGYDAVRRQQRLRAGEDGPLLGVGVTTVIKASGGKGAVREGSARVKLLPTGRVVIETELSPHGQGTATTFAQLAADTLGVHPEDVDVVHGDTDVIPAGGGTTSSRGLAVGGSAAYLALQRVRERVVALAAARLDCAPADVRLANGAATSARNASAGVGLGALAAAASPPIDESVDYTLPNNPFAFAAHVAVVEVDPETGGVRLARYVAVQDCGRVVNPMIVRGQVHGGVVQGIGQALSEAVVYDERGGPVGTNLMSYGVPEAADVPNLVLDFLESPSSTNPLGIKGIGELPTVAAPVAVANAVMDALAPLGVRHVDMPLTPSKIWQAMRFNAKAPSRKDH